MRGKGRAVAMQCYLFRVGVLKELSTNVSVSLYKLVFFFFLADDFGT